MAVLKSISFILVLTISAGSLTDLQDLAKLPYLIEHYNQHRSKDERFSLNDFFDLHYGNQAAEHDKEEHEQHKGLPFKAPEDSSIHSPIYFSERPSTSTRGIGATTNYTNFYSTVLPAGFHQAIFQPPRKG